MFGEVSGADVWESEDDINKKKKDTGMGVPEKSFLRDFIWAWVSMPITTCHPGHLESSLYGRKS